MKQDVEITLGRSILPSSKELFEKEDVPTKKYQYDNMEVVVTIWRKYNQCEIIVNKNGEKRTTSLSFYLNEKAFDDFKEFLAQAGKMR